MASGMMRGTRTTMATIIDRLAAAMNRPKALNVEIATTLDMTQAQSGG